MKSIRERFAHSQPPKSQALSDEPPASPPPAPLTTEVYPEVSAATDRIPPEQHTHKHLNHHVLPQPVWDRGRRVIGGNRPNRSLCHCVDFHLLCLTVITTLFGSSCSLFQPVPGVGTVRHGSPSPSHSPAAGLPVSPCRDPQPRQVTLPAPAPYVDPELDSSLGPLILKIGALNVKGIKFNLSFVHVYHFLNKLDVLCISEHWLHSYDLYILYDVHPNFVSWGDLSS